MIVFGPVPSRRLGRSLGINNIPPKICSFNCVYCQLGRTRRLALNRRTFYPIDQILGEVEEKLDQAEKTGHAVDYLTFVADGEPTLDASLEILLQKLKSFPPKLAVITNSSLIWQQDVRNALMNADWVSVKTDSVDEKIWKKINRPHGRLNLDAIMAGITLFSSTFKGKLHTETMLVRDLNDNPDQIRQLAGFIQSLQVETAFLSIPTRPPAESRVQPPEEQSLIQAYEIMKDADLNVEYLIAYEGNTFSLTGEIQKDLLSITSVHPMRKDAVLHFLEQAEADWSSVQILLDNGDLIEKTFRGQLFYLRKLNPITNSTSSTAEAKGD